MADSVSEAVITQLAEDIGTTSLKNGFWDCPTPALGLLNTKLLLVISEVIEAMDVLRTGRTAEDISMDWLADLMSEYQAEEFFEELADIIIRVLDIAGYYGWDIGATVISKAEKNKNRPYKHNKAF